MGCFTRTRKGRGGASRFRSSTRTILLTGNGFLAAAVGRTVAGLRALAFAASVAVALILARSLTRPIRAPQAIAER